MKSFHFFLKAVGNLHLTILQHPSWLLVQLAPWTAVTSIVGIAIDLGNCSGM